MKHYLPNSFCYVVAVNNQGQRNDVTERLRKGCMAFTADWQISDSEKGPCPSRYSERKRNQTVSNFNIAGSEAKYFEPFLRTHSPGNIHFLFAVTLIVSIKSQWAASLISASCLRFVYYSALFRFMVFREQN